MANLMVAYKGSFSYETLLNMPLPELLEWQEHMNEINDRIKREMEKK